MRWLVFLGLFLSPLLAAAQSATDMASDPHYRLLLQNDQVRVFSLTLNQSEQTFIRYERNFLFITLQDSELVIWAEGSSPIPHYQFRQAEVHFWLGATEGMRNDSSRTFRAVIIDFLNPKITTYQYDYQNGWGYDSGAISQPGDPHAKFVGAISLGAGRACDVQLLPDDFFPPPEKQAGELLIPVTDVDLRTEGDIHLRKASGEAVWIAEGRKYDLTNTSNGPERFAIVQLWVEPASEKQ